ncbi:hypothetical protein HFV08_04645 [Streptomyces sp. LD120]|uniref:Uncharacterized protein n=1 Tax=Streptomyces physcomitrii TaxID=2724184 RepID=A0ABX1GWS6_9ACTN|nr:hypothetical protein [Streptomyces physcomitrii]
MAAVDWPLLLGVRHHGPGSARAVRAALDAARPRAVLIEGPPEADGLLALAAEEGMRPPVALLAHAVDEPGTSSFWPFAEFSPEWVALRWALRHGVPVRFIDLPAAHSLALHREERAARQEQRDGFPEVAPDGGRFPAEGPDGEAAPGEPGPGRGGEGQGPPDAGAVRSDPLAVLARTAGYDDPERWWEDAVEHRGASGAEALAPFEALAEAMTALRERPAGDTGHDRAEAEAEADAGQGPPSPREAPGQDRDLVREAHMRLRLRAAQKEYGEQVAVVCGAWHVPALRERPTLTADRALLKGLPKIRTEMTWVPWTHRRLSREGGYGAGIESPGWYGHLFHAPDRPVTRWMTKVAGLLREEDRIVSSAHVIEAVRLAETLAVMRGRPLAGLAETTDAIRAVLCEGSDVPLDLVRDRLVIGDVLGEVPDSAPAVPLQRDLTRLQRRLRLKPEALERELDLDLRGETDGARSRLLHRLRLLGIGWGEPAAGRGGTGTFRESWRLCWEPELSVRVAEAGVWGTTVQAAASAKAETEAVSATALAEVTALAEHCLLAGLPRALPVVMRVLADRAALDSDVGHLAQALPALVRSLRYGDVRGTDTGALAEVAAGLAERVFVGLPAACAALDPDAAQEMRRHLDAVHSAVGLLAAGPEGEGAGAGAGSGGPDGSATADGATGAEAAAVRATGADATGAESTGTEARGAVPTGADPTGIEPTGAEATGVEAAEASHPAGPDRSGIRTRWWRVLRVLAGRDTVAGVLRGRCARLLLDEGELTAEEAARLMGLALSRGTPPAEAAAWIEGFVGGGSGGMLLVHDERLLGLVDRWLTGVPETAFNDVLPLLRRTFSAYEAGVRRSLGELVRRGPAGADPAAGGPGPVLPGFAPELDGARADAVLPVLYLLLGRGGGTADASVVTGS